MEIEYKEIPNHEDYIISTNGEIWNKKENKEEDYFTNLIGRKAVILDNKQYSLDLLLLLTFKREEEEGYLIRYKDGNINNISLDNLFWYQPTFEEENEIAKEFKIPITKKVFVVNTDGDITMAFDKVADLAKATGIMPQQLYVYRNTYFRKIDAFVIDYDKMNRVEEIINEWKQHQMVNEMEKKNTARVRAITTLSKKEIDVEIETIKKQKEEVKKLKLELKKFKEEKYKLYVINTDFTIRKTYASLAEINKIYQKPNYFNNYQKNLSYSSLIDGYVVNAQQWENNKQSIIDRIKEKEHWKSTNNQMKIGKYDTKGNLLKVYDSVRQAIKENGSCVQKSLKEQIFNKQGFIFKYLD